MKYFQVSIQKVLYETKMCRTKFRVKFRVAEIPNFQYIGNQCDGDASKKHIK